MYGTWNKNLIGSRNARRGWGGRERRSLSSPPHSSSTSSIPPKFLSRTCKINRVLINKLGSGFRRGIRWKKIRDMVMVVGQKSEQTRCTYIYFLFFSFLFFFLFKYITRFIVFLSFLLSYPQLSNRSTETTKKKKKKKRYRERYREKERNKNGFTADRNEAPRSRASILDVWYVCACKRCWTACSSSRNKGIEISAGFHTRTYNGATCGASAGSSSRILDKYTWFIIIIVLFAKCSSGKIRGGGSLRFCARHGWSGGEGREGERSTNIHRWDFRNWAERWGDGGTGNWPIVIVAPLLAP